MPGIVDGAIDTEHVSWVGPLGLAVDLRLDGFAALMVLLVAGIGLVVFAYSAAYFSPSNASNGRTAGLLTLFAGAMLCVVLADNLFLLYTGWELTSITSYLLIGNDHTKTHARAAALHALLVTSFGGLAMLAGFILIGQQAGTYRLSELLTYPPHGTTVDVALVLILLGAFTKSAQYPFHSWLPGAMAAPTPVSAYLHSATMVKAGVYLVARFAPVYATTGIWRPLVLTVGAATMVFGGLRSMRQHDLKLLLAHGTVSQLGFLMVLFGIGTPAATAAGCVMLLAHAVFKAALFMSVGAVDRNLGTRDRREIPPLTAAWRPFVVVTIASAASMAGIPLLLGFVAKEAGFDALHEAAVVGSAAVLATVVAGSALTVAYAARLVSGTLGRDSRARNRAETLDFACGNRGPGGGYVGPIGVLAAVSVVLGVAPSLADGIIGAAAESLDGDSHGVHLAVWHGVNLALVLSAVALAAGAALFLGRRRVERLLALGTPIPSGTAVYAAVLRGTNTVSTRVTAVVQNGSLPIYAAIVLLTAAVVPETVLVAGTTWPGWPDFVDGSGQLVVVVALLGAALAAALARRRFVAALFLGATGYAMAGLFVVQGAPDLALTQVAIETLSTVLFVLVLRRLPDRFERTSSAEPADRAHRDRARRRGDGLHVRHRQPGVPHGAAGVDRDGGGGTARGPRPQHRQRDPRRHPRARHARRDHRARRRGDRRRGPGARRPAPSGDRRRTSPRPSAGGHGATR